MFAKFLKLTAVVLGLSLNFTSFAEAAGFEDWLTSEGQIALRLMKANISPAGAHVGAVIAAPPNQDPNYYFHWIRDSSLVVNSLFQIAPLHLNSSQSTAQIFRDYALFSQILQQTKTLTGLGEPRFNVDGSADNGAWSRPQNDGPALRILTFQNALNQKISSEVTQKIIEADAEYLLGHSQDPSFDLWEEVKGDHFYTRIVQMAALQKLIDIHFSDALKEQIQAVLALLQTELDSHWNSENKYFAVTLHRLEGAEAYKHTDLDSAVILGVLHAGRDDGSFSIRDDRVLATAFALENTFKRIFDLNMTQIMPAPAIGRYEGDVYFGGNPWYLTTAAFAELNYRLALSLKKNPSFIITDLNREFLFEALQTLGIDESKLVVQKNLKDDPIFLNQTILSLKNRGDLFLKRIQNNTPESGELSEQFGREDGSQISAKNLTWSYASLLTAISQRNEL